jgi:hypothetical protein
MVGKIAGAFIAIAAILIVGSQAMRWFEENKANKFVDEGNVAVVTAQDAHKQAFDKYDALYGDENLKGLPGNRDKLAADAKVVGDLFHKAAEASRAAAGKFEQAAGEDLVDEHVREYWKLLVQAFNKQAEKQDLLAKDALLLTDPAVENDQKLADKRAELDKAVLTAHNAWEELDAKATKLKDVNAEQFKESKKDEPAK